jgi:hypothetical protein
MTTAVEPPPCEYKKPVRTTVRRETCAPTRALRSGSCNLAWHRCKVGFQEPACMGNVGQSALTAAPTHVGPICTGWAQPPHAHPHRGRQEAV